ncbi:hypothetical protein C6P45_000232 [Maudiozyma exigua]|uniref:t-SNARE affecting a late Golgi compartment protein 1 n=1 Tax=Maudiozyma exigua TaxID=34358 RepID=A0A9P6WA48_MAUEX|nr:hypothetical protein C6P45_000232 [Kazachstania exigua]
MSDTMEDPFDQVANDTQEQIDRLKIYLATHGKDQEVEDIMNDIKETMVDLDRSILVMKRSDQDVSAREQKLASIRNAFESLSTSKPVEGSSSINENSEEHQTILLDDEHESRTDDAISGGMSNPFQEQILKEQDTHLDDIHKTMQNLHLHAQTMGQELEDQGAILDELDENFDSITNKVQRGRRQLEWIYEKNKEKYNDCCIGLLIIALIVLLVLAFIA